MIELIAVSTFLLTMFAVFFTPEEARNGMNGVGKKIGKVFRFVADILDPPEKP
jgi:hypothetical protein